MRPSAKNIVDVYLRADPRQTAEGLTWYDDAHTVARELDPEDPDRAAAVIAASSPLEPWQRNVQLARTAYAAGRLDGGTLPENVDKVNRIMAGEDPSHVLNGPKVTRFRRVISDPDQGKREVVIDRHAFDVAVGRKTDDETRSRVLGRKGIYERFERAYPRQPRSWTSSLASYRRSPGSCGVSFTRRVAAAKR